MKAVARIAIFVLLFLGVRLAWSTTVVPMSVERLTQASTNVVEARAVEAWSQWDSNRNLIHTYTRFQVMRSLKGSAPTEIVVKQLGGTAGGYTQVVAGVRGWTRGEDAVLFLHPSEANDGTFVVSGLMQGDFRAFHAATGEVRVSNGVPQVSTFNPATHATGTYHGSAMTLQELETRIAKAVAQ